ncbi:MAG: DapH/DapD/GlmU-related protein [Thermoplasmatota archaeon]
MISENAVIHENVVLGKGCIIEDFAVIGAPLAGDEKHPPTTIGEGAVIRSHTVIYAGNRIGKNFQTGNKANIREFNVIGDDVSIGTLSVVEHHVEIENGVRIHSQVFVPEYCRLMEGAWIGPNAVLTNARYPKTRHTKERLEGVIVGKGAKIGANSTVLPGVRIGDGALVGAGSVVTRDVDDLAITFGNPSRRIGWVCQCGLPLRGMEENVLGCDDCGRSYRAAEGRLYPTTP